jgi:Uma2 family endonuclease
MASPASIRTLADLQVRLGGVPLDRIRFHPAPGLATVTDVIDVQQREGRLCELIDGVLVEKAMGYNESGLAGFLLSLLNAFVIPRNLGLVTGADGIMEIIADLVRIPDVAFTSWDRFPGRRRPSDPVPQIAPNLAVEVLSRSNTPGEIRIKVGDYFRAGVNLVWIVDPVSRTVEVFTSATNSLTWHVGDTLDGGTVLLGFVLPLAELFAELDRHG